MNFENSIPFDPGYGKHLGNFYIDVDYAYEQLQRLKNFNQKKFQFQKFFPVIKSELDMYLNFYIGCIMWAVFIKQYENKEISENPAFNQNYTDEEGLFQINYLREYIPKFEKDVKYFLGKEIKYENEVFELLDIYSKFLQMNKHFTDTKTSADLLIPVKIKNPDYEEILSTIKTVTESGDFEPLKKYRDLILNNAV